MEEEKIQDEEVLLEEKDVWDVIEFARYLSGSTFGYNYLSPETLNARLKDINLNPVQADITTLETAMKNPKESEDTLRAFSQDFELQSMVYKRLISYLSNMLSFDVTYISNAKPEDYAKPRYLKDLELIEEFLDKFEYKKEFRIVIREMLRNDTYFGCFREVENKYILQELPPEYCKITGRWENGYIFNFNMYWFWQTGIDINDYPKFFIDKYKEMTDNRQNLKSGKGFLEPGLSKNMGWNDWVEVPVDIGVCFKLSPELATNLPYFSPLFNDLVLQPLMRNLQKNLNMAAASRMITGEVPMLSKEIKATVKDSIAVTPELLGRFMALVQSAISSSIKVASAPLQNIKGIEFESDNEMYDSYIRTALASSGINTNLIFSSNIKPNAIETQLSLNVDEQMMTALYEQFEDFMNYRLSKITNHFKFMLSFEGTDFSTDRDKRFERAMSLFDKGIILEHKIAASLGMKPAQLRKHMEQSAASDFVNKLTPPSHLQQLEIIKETAEQQAQTMNNPMNIPKPNTDTSSSQSGAGRPKKSISELGEEGMRTRETGQNVAKGGKIGI